MTNEELKDKTVLIKFAGAENKHPVPIKIKAFSDAGIWFQDRNIAHEFTGDVHFPQAGQNPHVFVPLSQIEWLMVSDTVVLQ